MRDADIDRLYQVNLDEFTTARNELAKRLGPDGVSVRTLQKPSVAAWAVNQLHWRRRQVFDRLIKASERVRAAHAAVLRGKAGDVSAAEAAHQEAIHAAAGEIRAILRDAGDPASSATMLAIGETLQSLPGAGKPGRLARPLKPQGLEALEGLVVKGKPGSGTSTTQGRTATTGGRTGTTDGRAFGSGLAPSPAPSPRAEIAEINKRIKAARADERRAMQALAAAREALARAQREQERLQHQIQFALKQIQDSRDAIGREDLRQREAAAEIARLQTRLDHLTS